MDKTNFGMRLLPLIFAFFAITSQMKAQTQIGEITAGSASCNLNIPVCNGDTILLEPTNTTNYTNFKWYYGSVAPANLISGPNAGQGVVSVSGGSLTAVTPGGTYILTGEYATPAGCATLNDQITLDFQPVPNLTTTPDTICTAAGESSNLVLRVTDGNSVAGTTSWFVTLDDAQNNTNALGSTTVTPASSTTYYVRKTSSGSAGCFDIDSARVVVSCLSLGNQVWYDTDNSGTKNGAEAGIANVTVHLFLDANADGNIAGAEETPIATDVTDASGLYLFEGLKEGKYFVGIPATETGSGETLENLFSSQTTRNGNGSISETTANNVDSNNSDTDDNGTELTSGFYSGGVMSSQIMLMYLTEPTGENPDADATDPDSNDNQTADFGFYGMSIGSLVFMDIANDGDFDSGTDMGLASVTVKLYSGDGSTLLATTTTGADGRYLFANLPEGSYIAAVDMTSPSLTGKQSSDNIGTSATPNSTDNDDNGTSLIGNEIWSNVFVLDADAAPTSESDQSQTTGAGMGQTPVKDNALTPDQNSNLHVDFGFKGDCPTIASPSSDQTVCAELVGGTAGSNISVSTSLTAANSVRFVRFASAQTGSAMYTGGTDLETVTPSAGTATYTFDIADFSNAGTTPVTYYVYAVMEPASPDVTCRPFQEIEVTVNPRPAASPASQTACETAAGGGTAVFTLSASDATVLNGQTGMTVTYHDNQTDADNDANAITSKTASNGTVVFARVETANGCYRTSQVTLNVNLRPIFTLSLPVVCPGDNPEVQITLGAGADANPQTSVNGGTAFAFSTLSPAGRLTVADGVTLGASNSVVLTNANTCDNSQSINAGNVIPQVCLPMRVVKVNGGN